MPCGEAWTAASCHSIGKIHVNRNQHAWIAYLQTRWLLIGEAQHKFPNWSYRNVFAKNFCCCFEYFEILLQFISSIRALDIMWCSSFVEKTCSSFVWSGNLLKWTSGMLCRYLGFWGIVAVCKLKYISQISFIYNPTSLVSSYHSVSTTSINSRSEKSWHWFVLVVVLS